MTQEQKILKIFSNVELVVGAVNLVIAVLMFVGGGAALGNAPAIVEEGIATAEDMSAFGNVAFNLGVISLVNAVISFLNWHFLKKVSEDAAKYKGAWIVSIIGAAFAGIGLILNLFGQGTNIPQNVVSLALNGFILYLVNKVKSTAA